MKLLLVGATGLVGSHVLHLALEDQRIGEIVAPVRRALPEHPKLVAPLVDFELLPENTSWWRADAVICTLGTTMKTAGSRSAFRRVDHDYPLSIAHLARRHGTPTYVLNSAMGANERSLFFYPRVKGELERDLARIGFSSLTFVRPGLIGGHRDEVRSSEQAAVRIVTLFGPVLPSRWRINPAERIAGRLLDAALDPVPGNHVVSSDELA